MKRKNKGNSNAVLPTKRKTRSTTRKDLLVENILNTFDQPTCPEDDKVLRVFKSHSVKPAGEKALQDLVEYDEKGLCCYLIFFLIS